MAGIGFVLRRLAQQDNLLGALQAYGYSALVTSGPWLFTILSVGGINVMGVRFFGVEGIETFRIVLIYNFAFSLALSGPVLMVVTRFLADSIYLKDVEGAPALLIAGIALVFATQAPFVLPLYLWYVDMEDLDRLMAIVNYFLIAGVWLVSVFLTALKDFRSIGTTFFVGMASAFGAAVASASTFGTTGLLIGFNIGMMLILFVLCMRVFAEYPYPLVRPFAFLAYFRKFWDLALAGFAYNLAIWADKWVMWFAVEREISSTRLISFPIYDSAMFLAYLSIVPAMAIFIVAIETNFFERYLDYYRGIQNHATLEQIRRAHRAISQELNTSGRNLIVLQAVIAALVVLLSPQIFDLLQLPSRQLGVFRLGVLGALFHILLLFTMIVLSYFDLRRTMLWINLFFLVSNVLFTWVTLELGFAWYGYGYFLSSLLTFCLAYALCVNSIAKLSYLTFIRNNDSVG